MSKNNITTGISLQNKQIYDAALTAGHWVGYQKKWYTPSQFIRTIGKWEVNIAHVMIEDPRKVLLRGRAAFEKMIQDNAPKEQILNALKRLNTFSDKVWLHHKPSMYDLEHATI